MKRVLIIVGMIGLLAWLVVLYQRMNAPKPPHERVALPPLVPAAPPAAKPPRDMTAEQNAKEMEKRRRSKLMVKVH